MSEKLRRIPEALQIDTNYGQSTEKTDDILDFEGRKNRSKFLENPEADSFSLSTDHTKVGYLDKESGKWKLLDRKYAKEVLKAVEMAKRKRAIELVDLPVGKGETPGFPPLPE